MGDDGRRRLPAAIFTDVDGTLLDENSQVPPETFGLIHELRCAGIHFAASSGRRLDTLHEFFAPVVNEMDFVASNGAQVMVAGRLIDREVFSHIGLQRLKETVDRFDCLHIALFDRTRSFLLDDEDRFEREIDKDLLEAVRVFDVPDPEVNILKASVFCDTPAYTMDMAYVLQRELGDWFVFAPSGSKWIDVMQMGVSKASGIQQIMDYLGICADEVMAFGDAMNDYEILRLVGHPIAMGNGRYAAKQVAERVIGNNTEQAVQAEMRRILEAARR